MIGTSTLHRTFSVPDVGRQLRESPALAEVGRQGIRYARALAERAGTRARQYTSEIAFAQLVTVKDQDRYVVG